MGEIILAQLISYFHFRSRLAQSRRTFHIFSHTLFRKQVLMLGVNN